MNTILNPKNDVAFKRLFGTEKNKDILITLINNVLRNQLHKEIEDVTFLKTFQDPEHIARKQSIVDVLCKDKDDCKYIIEMQVARTGGFQERAQYYASKAYISQIDRNENYKNLKKVIFLAFTDFSIFPNKKHYKSEHRTLDNKTYENDLDKISFTFVDLVKFEKQRNKDIKKLSLEEKFYYFLNNAENLDVNNVKNIKTERIILKALEELNKFYWTKDQIVKYEDYEKGILDNKSALINAKEEGIKIGKIKGKKEGKIEGKKEGKKEERIEIAKKMIKSGLKISFISEVTGLSGREIQELQRLEVY